MNFSKVSLFAVFVTLIFSGGACSHAPDEFSKSEIPSMIISATPLQTGNEIGYLAPEFSILTTTGEEISYSGSRINGIPKFLFFFSPT